MKRLSLLIPLSLSLAASTALAGFTPGNVVVLQCTHSSTGGSGVLIEYNQAGATGYQVTLPSNGATDSGTSIVFGNNSIAEP